MRGLLVRSCRRLMTHDSCLVFHSPPSISVGYQSGTAAVPSASARDGDQHMLGIRGCFLFFEYSARPLRSGFRRQNKGDMDKRRKLRDRLYNGCDYLSSNQGWKRPVLGHGHVWKVPDRGSQVRVSSSWTAFPDRWCACACASIATAARHLTGVSG
jgi:hypothetical protein